MLSCIYKGRVKHRRLKPFHQFSYGLFMLYLDLDEMPMLLKQGIGPGKRFFSPASFLRKDHLGNPAIPLAEAVRNLVKERTGASPVGPIRMLTLLRNFGCYFCPLCLYYCFDPDGKTVRQIVGEVTNTPWLQKHWYVLWEGNRKGPSTDLCFAHSKDFHVSPFMDMNMRYEWSLNSPGHDLNVSLASCVEDRPIFEVSLVLKRHELSRNSMALALWRYPWMSARVIQGIYWQALHLWRKKCKFYGHPNSVSSGAPGRS